MAVVKGDTTHNRIYVGITSEAIKFCIIDPSSASNEKIFYEYIKYEPISG